MGFVRLSAFFLRHVIWTGRLKVLYAHKRRYNSKKSDSIKHIITHYIVQDKKRTRTKIWDLNDGLQPIPHSREFLHEGLDNSWVQKWRLEGRYSRSPEQKGMCICMKVKIDWLNFRKWSWKWLVAGREGQPKYLYCGSALSYSLPAMVMYEVMFAHMPSFPRYFSTT